MIPIPLCDHFLHFPLLVKFALVRRENSLCEQLESLKMRAKLGKIGSTRFSFGKSPLATAANPKTPRGFVFDRHRRQSQNP